jgi:hypothetical protein
LTHLKTFTLEEQSSFEVLAAEMKRILTLILGVCNFWGITTTCTGSPSFYAAAAAAFQPSIPLYFRII